MPNFNVSGRKLDALVVYLEGLKEVVVTNERVERLELIWESRPGILGWLTTTDHKRIGLLYFWTTLVLFAAGGAEALLIRTQLAQPNQHVVSPQTFDELFSMH